MSEYMTEYEEKLEWCSYWLPDGDKIFWRYAYSFRQNTRAW